MGDSQPNVQNKQDQDDDMGVMDDLTVASIT